MDDSIYRNQSIAEENIDPHSRPAKNKFGEWSENVSSHTHLGYKEEKEELTEEEREKRIKAIDEVIKNDLK